LLVVPSGESAKRREVQRDLEDALFSLGADRETVLVALGGGATLDLVGFVASTFLRGVPLILIPTTLLAMVDASIGGKNGINTSQGKNLLGTFYVPKAILIDLGFLKTLPKEEWLHGLAEIFKIALVRDPSLLEDPNRMIRRAIEAKMEIVKEDPFERGIRRILNFGHTVGHALEVVGKISHGKAVAIGSVAEAYLSMRIGFLGDSDFRQIEKLCATLFNDSLVLPNPVDPEQFLSALAFDKKKVNGLVRSVLIDRIGHALPFEGDYCRAIEREDLLGALSYVHHTFSAKRNSHCPSF
jgi:3-dehydroquinate synthase